MDIDQIKKYFKSQEFQENAIEAFREADKDKSGYLDFQELSKDLKEFYEQLGIQPPDINQMKTLIDSYDLDGNGQIDFAEYKVIIKDMILMYAEQQEQAENERGTYTSQVQVQRVVELKKSEAPDFINSTFKQEIINAVGYDDFEYVIFLWDELINIYNDQDQQQNVNFILVADGSEQLPYYNLTIKGGWGKSFRAKYLINSKGSFRYDENKNWKEFGKAFYKGFKKGIEIGEFLAGLQ